MAHYTQSTDFPYHYDMWQYTSTGAVGGIIGNADLNISYVDYPKYIRENGYNHLN
jgi:GH25 family lysozyme M1 (1,4-beta-N-acetylmuramidase)